MTGVAAMLGTYRECVRHLSAARVLCDAAAPAAPAQAVGGGEHLLLGGSP